MKVEDLMIGDWVNMHGDNWRATLATLQLAWDKPGTIKPIPITKDILKNNDILYRKSSFYYIINDDKDLECTHYIYQTVQEDWAIGVDTGAYDCSVFARIKYVHELQHALKLCGIDKEIVV
jgi:hypothetical protein